jgi:hypothetical protein
MSSIARWSYTATLTVWPASSYDQYGQPSFGSPYTLIGSWEVGGDTQTDETGAEFVAASKYYFELAADSTSLPKRGGYIKIGNHTATANPITAGAEQIKKVAGYDMGMFGAHEIPDWVVYT